MAQLLPIEENFFLLFRIDNPLDSSVEFMKLWYQYDADKSGYIEADELKVCMEFKIKGKILYFIIILYRVFSKISFLKREEVKKLQKKN